jgi:hypothetical protein
MTSEVTFYKLRWHNVVLTAQDITQKHIKAMRDDLQQLDMIIENHNWDELHRELQLEVTMAREQSANIRKHLEELDVEETPLRSVPN